MEILFIGLFLEGLIFLSMTFLIYVKSMRFDKVIPRGLLFLVTLSIIISILLGALDSYNYPGKYSVPTYRLVTFINPSNSVQQFICQASVLWINIQNAQYYEEIFYRILFIPVLLCWILVPIVPAISSWNQRD
jgi:hypothetical protein